MAAESTRRSDRIALTMGVQISGMDMAGQVFADEGKTLLISRHGAKIVLARGLVPQQEVSIRCNTTKREANARVVGQLGTSPEGYIYGIEVTDPTVNIWRIEFPPVEESAMAAGRALLECMACHHRELVLLNDLELEVFEASERLSRDCKRCNDVTIWRECLYEAASEPAAPPLQLKVETPVNPFALEIPVTPRTHNERKSPRLSIHVQFCVRTPQYGEDIGTTEDVSRGGFCFKSPNHYGMGLLIEAAVPHVRGGANIFVSARIAWAQEVRDYGVTVYGVAYVHAQKGKRPLEG